MAGLPVAGSFDTTLNGVTLTSPVTGALPWVDPPGGVSAYLARLRTNVGRTNVGSMLLLVDRLWHNGGFTITSTSAQSIASPTWPARDEDEATAGKGVLLALMASALTGSGSPVISVSYTNSAGVSGRTGTSILSTQGSINPGILYMLGLQAGDLGVQSVQSMTLSASWTTGVVNLVAYRPLAFLPTDAFARTCSIDAISGAMPKIPNGAVLEPWFLCSSSNLITDQVEATYAFG